MKKLLLTWAVMSVLAVLAGAAPMPQLVNYQGILYDAGGAPVPTGYYRISVKLWDAEAGGTLQWGETYNVYVKDGRFNVLLGNKGNPVTAPAGATTNLAVAFTGGASRYLGLTIHEALGVPVAGASEIAPRQRVSSVPSALYASDAAALNGRAPDQFINATQLPSAPVSPAAAVSWNGLAGQVAPVAFPATNVMDITGTANDGSNATLRVKSGTSALLLDGSEVDGTLDLRLNSTIRKEIALHGPVKLYNGYALDLNGSGISSGGSATQNTIHIAGPNVGQKENLSDGVHLGMNTSGNPHFELVRNGGYPHINFGIRNTGDCDAYLLLVPDGRFQIGCTTGTIQILGNRVEVEKGLHVKGAGRGHSSLPDGIHAGIDVSGNAHVDMVGSNKSPYIDFSSSNTMDYEARIVMPSPGVLRIEGKVDALGAAVNKSADTTYTAESDGFLYVGVFSGYFKVVVNGSDLAWIRTTTSGYGSYQASVYPIARGETYRVTRISGEPIKVLKWRPIGK